MSEIAQNEFNDKTNIKVVGVGGAGGNAVNRMIAEGLQNVEFVAVNTDAKDLLRSDADVKISLSDKSSRGLGAGADPERGAKAAQDHQSDIEEALRGADMVFVTDGECVLPDSFLEKLKAEQSARGFQITGILLDQEDAGFEFSLREFCTNVYRTSQLSRDQIAEQLVVSRVA